MKIFNFKLESKLDLHFDVKFNGESNGDSPKAQKPYLHPYTIWHLLTRPLIGIKTKELNGKKILITMRLFWHIRPEGLCEFFWSWDSLFNIG